MIITDCLRYDTLAVCIALVTVLIAYFKSSFQYWKKKGLFGPVPTIPNGHFTDVIFLKKTIGEVWRDIYFDLKSKGLRHGGVYFITKPMYIPIDLEIIKGILLKNFQHFLGHGTHVNEHVDPLSANIFNLEGPKWRNIRNKLTPAVTSGKMKMMFQMLAEHSSVLEKKLESTCQKGPVDIRDIMGRFTIDVIGTCCFGINCNSLKNPDSEFYEYGMKAFNAGFIGTVRQLVSVFLPHKFLDAINYRFLDKTVSRFFLEMVKDTVSYREKNNVFRKDFIHMMIQLKNRGKLSEDEKLFDNDSETKGTLTVEEIAAQSFMFFVAGFETSSSTMNFAGLELALNPEAQDKARQEIYTVLAKYGGKITYEGVMEMNYLENVICETLRKYPPLQFLFRKCSKEYQVPGTDVVIDKGTYVFVPMLGIHYDPEYYPDPEKFEPDRFNEENKKTRPPYTWMPFGEGPRICIGLRLGMLQTKVGLITLLRNFELTLNKKTKMPVTFCKLGLISASEGGIWIDLRKLDKSDM